MHFQVFFLQAKKCTRIFQWQEDLNVVVASALSSRKLCLSFLKFYILAKIFGETFIMYLKSTSFPSDSDKSLLSPEQNKLKESEKRFCR